MRSHVNACGCVGMRGDTGLPVSDSLSCLPMCDLDVSLSRSAEQMIISCKKNKESMLSARRSLGLNWGTGRGQNDAVRALSLLCCAFLAGFQLDPHMGLSFPICKARSLLAPVPGYPALF